MISKDKEFRIFKVELLYCISVLVWKRRIVVEFNWCLVYHLENPSIGENRVKGQIGG